MPVPKTAANFTSVPRAGRGSLTAPPGYRRPRESKGGGVRRFCGVEQWKGQPGRGQPTSPPPTTGPCRPRGLPRPSGENQPHEREPGRKGQLDCPARVPQSKGVQRGRGQTLLWGRTVERSAGKGPANFRAPDDGPVLPAGASPPAAASPPANGLRWGDGLIAIPEDCGLRCRGRSSYQSGSGQFHRFSPPE